MARDPVVTEILERERAILREQLEDLSVRTQSARKRAAELGQEAADLTQRLDAIEAELGVGAFEDISEGVTA